MTDQRAGVVAGVDAHTDEHHVAVVDAQRRLLGAAAFPTTAEGYARLISWLRGMVAAGYPVTRVTSFAHGKPEARAAEGLRLRIRSPSGADREVAPLDHEGQPGRGVGAIERGIRVVEALDEHLAHPVGVRLPVIAVVLDREDPASADDH